VKQVDGVFVKSIEEITIFESPDGGKTVYSRKSAETDRTLVWEDPEAKKEKLFQQRWLEWRDILEASKTNPGLADLIEKAETFYRLLK
jgi:hypothetical protein